MERADKIIASALNITRKDASALIKKGRITADGKTVLNTGEKLDEKSALILFDGKKIKYSKFVYIMMNKPKGVISASDGKGDKTVVDILPDDMKRRNLFPAGRLDKDTTGFMLITDDGAFAHDILSPKKHIEKTYRAVLDKPFGDDTIKSFSDGVKLKDCVCMPASLKALNENRTEAEIVIKQGIYHQIKRMFRAFGITVTELERAKMGGLRLDKNLRPGECRLITPEELKRITEDSGNSENNY